MAEQGVRFYASAAPSWWPYQLVSLGNRRLPPRRIGYYSVLVDNGMFAYTKTSRTPPRLDEWYHRLLLFLQEIERLRRPREVLVILPDWLYEPSFVLDALEHPLAARICSRYRCLAVVHSDKRWNGYKESAEDLAAYKDILYGLAAPLKLTCSRFSLRAMRRIIRRECQVTIVEQVCSVAKRYGLACHGLGALLNPQHIKRLAELGLSSFDSSSWTRPNNSVIAKTNWSAKTSTEKERFFTAVLQRLGSHVELTGIKTVEVVAH